MPDGTLAGIAVASAATIVGLLMLRFLAWRCLRARLAASPRTGGVGRNRSTLLVLAALAAALFAAAAVLTMAGTPGGVDRAAAQWTAVLRSGASVAFWQLVTDMGSSGAVAIGAVVAGVLLWSAGRAGDLRPLGLALIGALATTWATKYALGLPRPVFVTTTTAVSPTFPSAHAAGAVALYGTLAWLVAARLPRPRARFEVGFWAVVLIAAIGFSRVFLGVHNASDVAGGYLAGAAWTLLALAIASGEGERRAA